MKMGREGCRHATGLLIGETSYSLPEDAKAGPSGSGVEVSSRLWAAPFCGFLFIFNALFILIYEELRDPLGQFRVWWLFFEPGLFGWKPWKSDYVLICGLGWKGREIAIKLLYPWTRAHCMADKARADPGGRQTGAEKPGRRRVVVIEKDRDNLFIGDLRQAAALVFVGNATDEATLRKARVKKAGEIYVVSANDETDRRIVGQIDRIVAPRREVKCLDNDRDFSED